LFDEEMVQAELDLLMVAAATKSNPHITQEWNSRMKHLAEATQVGGQKVPKKGSSASVKFFIDQCSKFLDFKSKVYKA
jgi:hypothetical protein